MGRLTRAATYGAVGFATDTAFNRISALLRGRPLLELHTSPWMLPLYALAQPLYEPVHSRLRGRPWPVRAAVYGAGFITVEYASGRALRRLRGEAPWDYSHARWQLHGVTRFDYFPFWALGGLTLERLHDRLTSSGPPPLPVPGAARRRHAATRSTARARDRSRS